MAKALFRFLRGELNGFYIQSINTMMNDITKETKQFFFDFYKMQFEQGKIDDVTLYNLGRFAGIFLPRLPQEAIRSAVRMTESEYDEQLQYEFSERGLFKPADEDFVFEQKVIDDTGLPDINTLATENQRSSLIGTETEEGYISEDTLRMKNNEVFDDDGNVRPEVILSSPPENKAYSEFYGDDFLLLSEGENDNVPISFSVFFDLFKAIQYIRYNGAVLTGLVRIIEILCPEGLVTIDSIAVSEDGRSVVVSYSTDFSVDINLKQDRINLMLYVAQMKFVQVRMTESL